MGMFDQASTPVTESPETGHEEVMAEETETTMEDDEETTETVEDEQEIETYEETEDSDSDEEEHSEELLAGKYKTPQELAKAYKELQREYTKAKQELKQQPPQTQPNPIMAKDGEDPQDAVWRALNQDPIGTLNYFVKQLVSQEINPIKQEREERTFSENFKPIAKQYGRQLSEEGAMGQYVDKIKELAQEFGRPELAQNPTPRMMKLAAEELFGTTTQALLQKTRQETRQEQERARRLKQGGAVQTSKKPPQTQKSEDDLIRESILNAGGRSGFFS